MQTQTIEIFSGYDFHYAQQAIWDAYCDPKARFIVAACGRRMGKTELSKYMLALVIAQGKRAAYMAPTAKMMEQMWEEVKALLGAIIKDISEQFHRLDFINGGVLEFWSLGNEDGPRGRSYDLVILDECALLPSGRIFEATVRPTISDRKGKAVFLSTPRGLNWFFDYFQRGLEEVRAKFPRWRSFQFPSNANPLMTDEEMEDARNTLPSQIFKEEYLASFESGEDAIFRNLDKVNTATWQEEGQPSHVYVAGVDLARSSDFSVTTVIDVTAMEVCHIDRHRGIDWQLQMDRVAALHERFDFQTIMVEDNAAGSVVVEALQMRGLPIVPFHTGNISKVQVINALSMRFERKELRIPNDRTLINELLAYKAERLPISNLIRYSAPDGQHDDMVMSLAFANWASESWTVGEAGFVRFRH